jgi:hypothetical protein
MKKKIILVFAIILLLALVTWMLYDLFTGSEGLMKNPYDYGMNALRKAGTLPAYREITPLRPVFNQVTSIAAGKDGRIYIAGNKALEIMDSAGRFLSCFKIPGRASCLAVMSDGQLVIGMEDHIELRSPAGMLITAWKPVDTNSIITSVATRQNTIFAADAGNKVVYQYDLDGKLQARIGEKDPFRNIPGFIIPSPYFDVAINPAGELWVANTGRYKLEKYGGDGSLLTSWGEASATLEGFAGCCNPSHFTFLPDGSFVTSEKGIERVKVYSPDGKFIALVAGPEAFDEGTRGLDLATGTNGRILVIDPFRNQVRVFLPRQKK